MTELIHCNSDPCQNGGTCNDDVTGITCDCTAGYTGPNCETSKTLQIVLFVDSCNYFKLITLCWTGDTTVKE